MEKARQYPAVKQGKVIGLAACVVAALGGWYLFRDKGPEGQVFHSIGGRWMATDVEWTQINGGWRVGTVLYPRSVRISGLSESAILRGLCNSVVAVRPESPVKTMTSDDIFRVDMNIALPDPETGEYSTKLETLVPLPVTDRECQVERSAAVYFATYPGDLAGWALHLVAANVQDDGVTKRTLVFELQDGLELRTHDFPFQSACEAAILDPYIGVTPNGHLVVDEDGFVGDGPLEIVAQKTNQWGALFKTYRNNSTTFNVAGGACLQTESETA